MFAPVSLLHRSAVWLDVRAAANVVSVRDAGVRERARMVGPDDGQGRAGLPAGRQQNFVGGRLAACPAAFGRAVADELADRAGRVAATGSSVASGPPGQDAAAL